MTSTSTAPSVAGFAVGDDAWCIAWIGTRFTVVDVNEEDGRISLQAPMASLPYGAQIDLFPGIYWMVTHEGWDQIWQWPDRAGERYETVFDRYMASVALGEIVRGYYFDTGVGALRQGRHVTVAPEAAMNLRVHTLNVTRGNQVWVEPVAAVDAGGRLRSWRDVDPEVDQVDWRPVGPAAPARLGMSGYRWALSYGEFVLNWRDFLPDSPR